MITRRVLAGLLLVAATLLGTAAPAAHAAAAVPAGETGYAYNQVIGIANAVSSDVSLGEYTTINDSRTHIWINGTPSCLPFGHGTVTWRGVAGGNGTSKLDTGCNYQAYDNAGHLHKYYLRFELYAAGECVIGPGDFDAYYGQICRQ